tara:strand:- start:149 stop:493 length:345 start_codon:yes stop_codon:yes gene_type:complete
MANISNTTAGTNTFLESQPRFYNTDSSNLWQGVTASDNNFTIKNNNEHMNTQAKIAIFEVTRDEKGNINSSKFKVEFWMEKKKGASMELAAAKYLSKDFDPDLIVVKELYTADL